jgi:hypothetical protein
VDIFAGGSLPGAAAAIKPTRYVTTAQEQQLNNTENNCDYMVNNVWISH